MTAVLGIDIGGSSIKAALLEGHTVPALTARSGRYARPSPEDLAAALQEVLAQVGVGAAVPGRAKSVARVGLCVPGVIDPVSNAVQASVNLPGLVGVPLDGLVASAVGGPVASLEIFSDARAAAHDWWSTAIPQPTGRLLALSLGTGVGACVLDDGVPLRVSGQSSGHLGQMDVSLDDTPPVGADGGAGSLEAYVGLPGLLARGWGEAESIIDRLTSADPPLRALVRALRIAHAIYRPNHISLLGGVGIRLAHRAGAIRDAIDDRLTSLARPGWTLRCGTSDFHAALGAARLAGAVPTKREIQ